MPRSDTDRFVSRLKSALMDCTKDELIEIICAYLTQRGFPGPGMARDIAGIIWSERVRSLRVKEAAAWEAYQAAPSWDDLAKEFSDSRDLDQKGRLAGQIIERKKEWRRLFDAHDRAQKACSRVLQDGAPDLW